MAAGGRAEVVGDGKHIRLVSKDGWEYVTRKTSNGIVVLVAVTDEGKLLLVEQFRPPVDANVIELPAGLVGDGRFRNETVESAARRELLEETGYEASEMTYVAAGCVSAGLSDELMTVFRAGGLRKTGEPDPDEHLTLHEIDLDQVNVWLADQERSGKIVDLKVYAGLNLLTRG